LQVVSLPYGNYCAPGWCAGAPQSEKNCWCTKSYKSVSPIDNMDRCCAVHDICLGSGGGKECDDRMCNCLKELNPEKKGDIEPAAGVGLDEALKTWRWMLGTFCGTTIPWH